MADLASRAVGCMVVLLVTFVLCWRSDQYAIAGEVLLQSPSPVRIALPQIAPQGRGRFSRWRCIGALDNVDEFQYRTCLFSDVCYDTRDGDFIFFAQPGTIAPTTVFDHRHGEQRAFRHRKHAGSHTDADFVALSKWVPYRQRASWSPRIQTEPMPADAIRALRQGLHALSAPFVPTNLGHVAWDEAFPLLVAMAQLGVYTTELR